jgi:hypothetical protein
LSSHRPAAQFGPNPRIADRRIAWFDAALLHQGVGLLSAPMSNPALTF